MKLLKKILIILLCIAALLITVFLTGRYGWKLGGFNACETTGIEQINVEEDRVRIRGFYPGSFPEGFCGYYSEEQDGTLYVGFRFSSVFGFFETGDFDITIPIKGDVSEVILKTSTNESTIWSKDDEFYGKLIFSLYTLDEKGVPQLLFDSTERNRYYYAGSFCFANLGSSGWNSSFVTTLKLEGHEMIDMTYTTDPADYVQMELTPLAQWTE